MRIVKKIVGIIFTILAVAYLFLGLRASGSGNDSQSILDSPEASGRLFATMIPVVLFGVIGLWFLFAKELEK